MVYQTVFETGLAKCPFWFPAVGLIFVAIGYALLRWHQNLQTVDDEWPNRRWPIRPPPKKSVKHFAWFCLGFSILWTVVALAGVTAECYRCVGSLSRGAAQVVEGRVTAFTPMPRGGHAMEHFTVNGVELSYSDDVVTCGFNNTASHGGPIREGGAGAGSL
jgi:hypothetical protein